MTRWLPHKGREGQDTRAPSVRRVRSSVATAPRPEDSSTAAAGTLPRTHELFEQNIPSGEIMFVTLCLPISTYRELSEQARLRGLTVAQFVAMAVGKQLEE